MFKKEELSKKVKMYLELQGKKIGDFVVEIRTEDGELYYTDEDYRGLKFKGIFDSGYPWEGTLYDNKYNIVYNGRFEYRYDILRYDGTDDYKKTIVYENNPDIYNMDDDMGEFDY